MAIRSESGQVLALNLPKSEISCDGVCHALKAPPCRLLHLLIENAESVVSRKTIYKEIWGYDFDPGTKIIEVQVHYLRGILASSNSGFEIKTYRGKGISLQMTQRFQPTSPYSSRHQ
ncbi:MULTISPECIES: winged helix-turn-helix domain-containing protein [Pseudomonas]|uniref:winged helix-turn-helix domain-containing protein n=1 Tax=Pseudomonas TaxID=286 RepID=UPI0009F27F53|nr:winged helix-turn-helix transcriptional regulator [Pseudomonas putida]RFQ03441.1 winged helix family transcriptional regulator [Pseudomonas putida]